MTNRRDSYEAWRKQFLHELGEDLRRNWQWLVPAGLVALALGIAIGRLWSTFPPVAALVTVGAAGLWMRLR